jgi:nucleotide-binding universal stress UspA family protein
MQKIIVPIDIADEDVAHSVLGRAKALASGFEVNIVIMYAIEAVPTYVLPRIPSDLLRQHESEAGTKLRSLATAHGLAERARFVVRHGKPQHEIVALAEEEGADLIVMASHQPTGADILLGSVAASVVRHAPCSVMVVR